MYATHTHTHTSLLTFNVFNRNHIVFYMVIKTDILLVKRKSERWIELRGGGAEKTKEKCRGARKGREKQEMVHREAEDGGRGDRELMVMDE